MTALPGTTNTKCYMKYFGTDAYAAPVIGIIGAAVMFTIGLVWIGYRARQAAVRGEGYGDHKDTHIELDTANLPRLVCSYLTNINRFDIKLYLNKTCIF